MKLRARKVWDTFDLPVTAGWTVTVRECTRADEQRLAREATTRRFDALASGVDGKLGAEVETLDRLKHARLRVRHLIAGWQGLTPEILEQVAPLEVGSDEELDLDALDAGDGTIRCDHEVMVWTSRERVRHSLPEYLWLRCDTKLFAGLVTAVSDRMAELKRAVDEEKKRASVAPQDVSSAA